MRGRSARLASESATVAKAVPAPSLVTARRSQAPAAASTGNSRSWRWSVRSRKPTASGPLSVGVSPRSTSRTGAETRSTCVGSRSQSTTRVLGAMRASRALITSGESQSSSTIVTMPSMIFARRVGMIAVCGIGRPRGCRKRAVTANQSANPPTVAASKPAATMRSQVALAKGPPWRPRWQAAAPPTATTRDTVPTRFWRAGALRAAGSTEGELILPRLRSGSGSRIGSPRRRSPTRPARVVCERAGDRASTCVANR